MALKRTGFRERVNVRLAPRPVTKLFLFRSKRNAVRVPEANHRKHKACLGFVYGFVKGSFRVLFWVRFGFV